MVLKKFYEINEFNEFDKRVVEDLVNTSFNETRENNVYFLFCKNKEVVKSYLDNYVSERVSGFSKGLKNNFSNLEIISLNNSGFQDGTFFNFLKGTNKTSDSPSKNYLVLGNIVENNVDHSKICSFLKKSEK